MLYPNKNVQIILYRKNDFMVIFLYNLCTVVSKQKMYRLYRKMTIYGIFSI